MHRKEEKRFIRKQVCKIECLNFPPSSLYDTVKRRPIGKDMQRGKGRQHELI